MIDSSLAESLHNPVQQLLKIPGTILVIYSINSSMLLNFLFRVSAIVLNSSPLFLTDIFWIFFERWLSMPAKLNFNNLRCF